MENTLDTPEFLASFNRGEKEAFEAINQKWYPELSAFCYNITNDECESKEIAARTIAILFERCATYETTFRYEAFLYVCARNRCILYLQKMRHLAESV